ncbi:MAG: response regulator [Lachnospiraceae bacterium]|nr:response regulator [Lachnospiraceae bacterium]
MANDYKRLLIIDDSEIDRSILKNILEIDFDIIEAENGYKGLETILNKRKEIDGILLDLHMPVLDGFHVLQLMKENGIIEIPVIIITAESTEQNLVKTVSYNIRDFICKPFDKDLIRNRLRTMFHIRWT